MTEERFLWDLRPGERGVVAAAMLPEEFRRRLEELGLTAGTAVECVGRSPLGDPAAYRVRGTRIALRRCDAGRILLR